MIMCKTPCLRLDVHRLNGDKVVAIQFKDAMKYYTHPNDKLLKEDIKKLGELNVPLDFLSNTSKDSVVRPSKNGKKSVPHVKADEILKKL